MRPRAGCLACLFTLLVLGAAASGQVVVNAGPDQSILRGQAAQLQGSVTNRTALDFWTADGDNATENMLLKYHEATGVTSVGPLQTSAGKIYGWPSDFEKIHGVVYGIETFDRRLYTLDATTGICTPVGAQVSYTRLFGLAWDPIHDKLYSVDQSSRKLLLLDRVTGTASVVLTLPSAHVNIRGLAYNVSDDRVYFTDDATEAIWKVDVATGQVNLVFILADGPDALVNEIDFFHGRLMGTFRTFNATTGAWSMQLAHIDPVRNDGRLLGPVLSELSAHSLVVNSIPEHVYWRQRYGPGEAVFAEPEDPATTATFTLPGRYVLELVADGVGAAVVDRVTIDVMPVNPGPYQQRRKLR